MSHGKAGSFVQSAQAERTYNLSGAVTVALNPQKDNGVVFAITAGVAAGPTAELKFDLDVTKYVPRIGDEFHVTVRETLNTPYFYTSVPSTHVNVSLTGAFASAEVDSPVTKSTLVLSLHPRTWTFTYAGGFWRVSSSTVGKKDIQKDIVSKLLNPLGVVELEAGSLSEVSSVYYGQPTGALQTLSDGVSTHYGVKSTVPHYLSKGTSKRTAVVARARTRGVSLTAGGSAGTVVTFADQASNGLLRYTEGSGWTSHSLGGGNIRGLCSGDSALFATAGNDLYVNNGINTTWTSVDTGAAVRSDVACRQYPDNTWKVFSTLSEIIRTWDGTTATTAYTHPSALPMIAVYACPGFTVAVGNSVVVVNTNSSTYYTSGVAANVSDLGGSNFFDVAISGGIVVAARYISSKVEYVYSCDGCRSWYIIPGRYDVAATAVTTTNRLRIAVPNVYSNAASDLPLLTGFMLPIPPPPSGKDPGFINCLVGTV